MTTIVLAILNLGTITQMIIGRATCFLNPTNTIIDTYTEKYYLTKGLKYVNHKWINLMWSSLWRMVKNVITIYYWRYFT